ncbi:GTP-binding protein [Alicyclobacillus suci]|uniref:GTP-binding protein n=1 Tax=Alicyclobacillus suci TaxID=2816080 RepID=UPI001A8D5C18|nr:GTP-binding protein [Alicyclobacillus suci]
MQNHTIPVTVLSGYLGSGKTTVLNHLLHHQHGMRIAVIVNDMSEINVDANLIKQNTNLSRTKEQLVEMTNGCICCTLRQDLVEEVRALAEKGRFDYILIESSGISEPIPVAQTFTYVDEEQGVNLSEFCHLDCMVTVVDANRFWHDFSSGESLLDRKQGIDDTDVREVVDLLIDQIEFCDVLLLNKCDLVDEEHLQKLEQMLRKLQPDAKIIRTTHGRVNPRELLNTHRFDFEKSSMAAGWIHELQKASHTPETEEYGITSFVYRRQKPFHPQRIAQWLENWPPEVVRAKDMMWLASRNDVAITFSQAGPSIQIGISGYWVAALPEEEQADVFAQEPEWATTFHPVWGDRINEIVLIGIDVNWPGLIESLDECLLTDDEMAEDWSPFTDSLPLYEDWEMDSEEAWVQ